MSFLYNSFNPQGTQPALQNYQQAGTGLNNLATQLQAQANGSGPNLANQLLQNATGQNVANQAALMAGQRGASGNVGLMSRQIAQQGANTQQQAVGQAAANRLQEQLSSQQQLGNVLGTQGSLGANILNANNQIGANVAGQNAKVNQGILGGIANAGASMLGMAEGGEANKGLLSSFTQENPNDPFGTAFGFNFVNGKKPAPATPLVDNSKQIQLPATQQVQPMSVQGTQIPTMMAAKGGAVNLPFAPHDYRNGGHVIAHSPKEKAVKPGNNYANDNIPAMLSEDEVVLPRDVTQSPNAPQAAARFMSEVMMGKHRKKK